ncbi:MAG: SPOR domain-containing protein [Burkholderiales bacterium]
MSKFSDQEAQFKKRARRRLIGAIALVVLAVAVLPFVLDNEPQPVSENISIQIPAQTSPPPTANAPTPDAPPAQTAATEAPAPEAKPAPPEPPSVLLDKPDDQTKRPEAAEKPKAGERRAEVAEKAQGDQFVVQLGAFTNPANAKQTQTKLKSAGIKSYTETVQSGDSKTIRVRAGPFATREQAEKIRAKLKAMGYSGMVAAK